MSPADTPTGPAPRACPRCGETPLDAEPLPSGELAWVCGACEGRLLEPVARASLGPALEPDPEALPDPFPGEALAPCSRCGGRFTRATLRTAADRTYACEGCGAVFLGVAAYVSARSYVPPEPRSVIDTRGLELEVDAVRPAARAAVVAGDAEALRRSVTAGVRERPVPAGVADARRDDALAAAIAESAARTEPLDAGLAHARLPVDEPVTATYGPLVAWSLAMLLATTHAVDLLLVPVQIQFHELGHAVAAWAAGRVAVPLPCGITLVPESPSTPFTLAQLALAGVGLAVGVRHRRAALVLWSAGWLVTLLSVRFFASESLQARLVLQGGFYGEVMLPAWLALLYHHDPLPRLRWDFVRLFALPVAASSMLRSLATFHAAVDRPGMLMGGTLLGGDDHGSDLERLVRDHGRDPSAVMRRVVATAVVLLVVVAAHHALAARRARRRAERPQAVPEPPRAP